MMDERVHEWMVSSIGGVYLAVCNSLDDDGNATCEAQLTSREIDERLNATEKLKKHPIMRHVMILFPSIADTLDGK